MCGTESLKSIPVNGLVLHYLEKGEGRPVVLLHGNGESHEIFETEISQLCSSGYHVFALDSRGHGANEPLQEYHYADMAEDVFQFIQKLGLHRPCLYGHSDGGIIALLLEIKHPGTLGKMASSGTNLSPDGLDRDFLDECRRINQDSPNPLITLILTEPHIAPSDLNLIGIPVLVTVGEKDLILRSETDTIVSSLPHAHLKVIQGADHGSYIVHSPVMGELLVPFFNAD